ncbi:putative RNA-binding protein Alsin2 isoform X1 [Leptinotarsa decemlineata]|uniref:putative RNA-binding protein Alsin2 isoform X1 n=2 Tax=Leptinotarsa decemlineata TaxID=7539 RepID=UPI003D304EB2
MTAHDQMRAMLDQLMGTGRNGENNKFQVKFNDPRVCKSFLLACCPHEILSSTRMDLGDCPKIHDLALRADFEKAQQTKDYFYDLDAMEHLQAFIGDCDRRTEAAKQRLAETQEELSAEVAVKANNVHELAEQIGQKLAKAEQLGEEGFVDESMKLMEEVDELRKKKLDAEQEYRNSMPASSYQQQKLRVCEVCSAYLGIHDNDRRLADHFGGKLHLGFIKIREKLTELEKTAEKRREDKKRAGKDRDRDNRDDRFDRRYREHYVGGRELDRRSKRHRSRSRERKEKEPRKERDDEGSKSSRSYRSRSRSRDRDRRSHSRHSGSSDKKRERDRD